MRTQIRRILVILTIMIVIGCGGKKYGAVKQKSPIIQGEGRVFKCGNGELESADQRFTRLLLESNDDAKTYRMMRILSGLLQDEDRIISLAGETLEQIESLEHDLKKTNDLLGEPDSDYPVRMEAKKQVERTNRKIKEHYSQMAIAYNRKMAELKFKFTEPAGLPEGQTETLPRIFPIR